uniref:Uncharacterized protein n=1 Tax=Triticum urartu TaxID=4572 RepID=A0A8R7TY41_TRIUA
MPTALSAPPQTLSTAATVLHHWRPRRRRPSLLALSPYRTRGSEGGPKSKRAAASRSRSRGAHIVTFLRPMAPLWSLPAAPATPSQMGGATAPQHACAGRARGSMAELHVQAVPPPDLNKNTDLVHVPGGLDHLHLHPLRLLAPHPLHLRLHPRHGLDARQPWPLCGQP